MIFGPHALHECVIASTDTNTVCCAYMQDGRLAQMVKASAKTTSCKSLSRRCEFDSRVNLFVWTCLLKVWLLPAGQGGFTVHRVCLEDGQMYWLSSTSTALVTAASRGKGALGRTMQKWRVVGIRLRGGKTSTMGLQLIC